MSELFALSGHRSSVAGLSFSADSRFLASAAGDATVRIWDLVEGMEVHTLHGGEGASFSGVAFAPDGKTVVASRKSPRPYGLHVWDAQSGKQLAAWPEERMPASVAYSPDGTTFAAGFMDGR